MILVVITYTIIFIKKSSLFLSSDFIMNVVSVDLLNGRQVVAFSKGHQLAYFSFWPHMHRHFLPVDIVLALLHSLNMILIIRHAKYYNPFEILWCTWGCSSWMWTGIWDDFRNLLSDVISDSGSHPTTAPPGASQNLERVILASTQIDSIQHHIHLIYRQRFDTEKL